MIAHLDPMVIKWDPSDVLQEVTFNLPIEGTLQGGGPYNLDISCTCHTRDGFLILVTYTNTSTATAGNRHGYFFHLPRLDAETRTFDYICYAGYVVGSDYNFINKPLVPTNAQGTEFCWVNLDEDTYITCLGCNIETKEGFFRF